MKTFVIGMGRMGRAISTLLQQAGYSVSLADTLAAARGYVLWDSTIFSCVPYHATVEVARHAVEIGADYVDLTEDIGARESVRVLSAMAPDNLFLSGTGLAPGYVNMIAGRLFRQVENPVSVEMYCGALPVDRLCNRFGYQISWSAEGLAREYTAPCESCVDGRIVKHPPASFTQAAQFPPWPNLEAFPTSGGAGTTPHTLNASNVVYCTLRYPGHLAQIKPLLQGSNLVQRLTAELGELEGADVVYVAVRVAGEDGELRHLERIKPQDGLTAIQYATAAGAIATWEAARGRIGFVRPEEL